MAHSRLNSPPGGCGLGPSICQWIVNAHGGAIAADRGEGKGAEFTVTLPSPAAAGKETSRVAALGTIG
jgi:signal transduction histidine kinase